MDNTKELNYQKKVSDFEKLQYFLYNCYHSKKCDIKQSYKELIYDLIEDGETSMALKVLLDIWPKYMEHI